MRFTNLAPEACETIDIAGMGENPATRSGPYFLIVWTCAAATISLEQDGPKRVAAAGRIAWRWIAPSKNFCVSAAAAARRARSCAAAEARCEASAAR